MRVVQLQRHGSVEGLVLTEVPRPSPRPSEIFVKIHATTVTSGDVALRKMPGALARSVKVARKSVLGHEFAGEVEAVGGQVTRFGIGVRVFGSTRGLTQGAYAEYLCVPETGVLATVPDTVPLEEAAPVPIGGMTALYFLQRANVAEARTVLIYGASGSVGTYAVQLAAHFGASVTGVCGTENVELVGSSGATRVIDYTRDHVTGVGTTYDVIFDAVGKAPTRRLERMGADGGAYVSVRQGLAEEGTEELIFLRDLLGAGELRAVIDRRYPLEEVRDAHRYVETGRKRGNVLITVATSAP